MAVAFTKVALPHGWLGNMAPFPLEHEGQRWRTAEALFQALRFDDPGIREEIRTRTSPMAAKMAAKRHKARMVVVPHGEEDVANMRLVLRLKLNQHQELRHRLLATGDEEIIEDCTRRPGGYGKVWGAVRKENGEWAGRNLLGQLWMGLRDELRGESPGVPGSRFYFTDSLICQNSSRKRGPSFTCKYSSRADACLSAAARSALTAGTFGRTSTGAQFTA